MHRFRVLIPLLAVLAVSIARADPLSLTDLQRLYKQGDYAGVVKGCTDALAPGGVTEPADRFKVAWLKAETQLRLKQADAAVDAFNAAAKETQVDRQAAIAKATAILISRSKNFIYTSLTIKPPAVKANESRPAPAQAVAPNPASTKSASMPAIEQAPVVLPRGHFEIIEPLHRTQAMQAMWTDERADAERMVKDKIQLKTLPAINDALDRINQAQPIALAAGSADWPQTQRDLLASAARLDANFAMKDMNEQMLDISKSQIKRRKGVHPKPMPQGQRDQLNKISQSIDAITVALKAMPEQLNVDKDLFDSQIDQAARLQDRASTILATD